MKCRFAVVFAIFAMLGGMFSASAAEKTHAKPVIPGITIERKAGGGYLGIEIIDGAFKLSFYGKDKKPVAADFSRALLRWDVTYKNTPERLILSTGSDGQHLTSSRVIRPPYNFQLFITLIAEDKERASETYALRFRQ